MKRTYKKLNDKGSILQIVLVTFLIMMFALTTCLFLIKEKTSLYHQIELLMKQKNLEIFLTEYYVEQMENNILFSDVYDSENYHIQSYVDDMGNFYEITTYIQSSEMSYHFLVQISTDHHQVIKLTY